MTEDQPPVAPAPAKPLLSMGLLLDWQVKGAGWSAMIAGSEIIVEPGRNGWRSYFQIGDEMVNEPNRTLEAALFDAEAAVLAALLTTRMWLRKELEQRGTLQARIDTASEALTSLGYVESEVETLEG